jgi:hypothetical protein
MKNLLKLLSLAMIFAFVMPVVAKAQKANFAGSWALNESKSSMPEGGGGRMMMREFSATQEANLLTRKSVGRDGTERISKYTLDGKESMNTMGENQIPSTATWSTDGKSLIIKTNMNFGGNSFTRTEVWSMPDAKTLQIVSTMPGRDGGAEMKMTMVYDKK